MQKTKREEKQKNQKATQKKKIRRQPLLTRLKEETSN